MTNETPLDIETLAALLYETDQRIRYGHVTISWADRPHGAAKQKARKNAEQILFKYTVIAKGES